MPLVRSLLVALLAGPLAVAATPVAAQPQPVGDAVAGSVDVLVADSVDVLVADPADGGVSLAVDGESLSHVGVTSARVTPAELDRLRAAGHTVDLDLPVRLTGQPPVVAATDASAPPGVRRIGARPVPDGGFAGVKVAVFDTGVAALPELNLTQSVRCQTGTCLVTAAHRDVNGHGTMSAGIIGAATTGVAPDVELVSYQVLRDDGNGTMSAIIAAIDHAIARGDIDVINMSLSGEERTVPTLEQALARANEAGITVIAAAGNDDADADDYFPGNLPQTISVSAIADFDGRPGGLGTTPPCAGSEVDDTHATFTNVGSTVDVAAPGVCTLTVDETGSEELYSGTSAAAPHVAGVVAHLLATTRPPRDATRPTAVRQAVTGTWAGTAAGACGYTPKRGFAHPVVIIGGCGADTPAPSATVPGAPRDVTATGGDRSVALRWSAPVDDGGSPIIDYRVQIAPTPSSGAATRTVSGTSVTVTGLDNDRTYTFTLTSRNRIGPSVPVQISAAPAEPLPPPPSPPAPPTGGSPGGGSGDGRDGGSSDRPRAGVTFRDVPDDHPFARDIQWLASSGITQGRADGTFGPGDRVTRAQMAAFLSRALDLRATSGIRFSDVPAAYTFAGDIDRLATAGITLGRGDGTFDPNGTVTRGQMAAFLSRGLELTATSGVRFVDVPSDHPFAADIDRLATARITQGRTDGTFGPGDRINRGQMAAFLHRGLAR